MAHGKVCLFRPVIFMCTYRIADGDLYSSVGLQVLHEVSWLIMVPINKMAACCYSSLKEWQSLHESVA